MEKKIDLKNVTKAFEMTLARFEAREKFINNWAKQNLLFYQGANFGTWKRVRRCYKLSNWITSAFVWSQTPEGYYFWKAVNDRWKHWVIKHINENDEN